MLMNYLCQGHPSVYVIYHGHCSAHVCVCVHMCVCVCICTHAQPFTLSSRHLLKKRQCIFHADKHWTFTVSSMKDNRLLDKYDKHLNTQPLHRNGQKTIDIYIHI